MISMARASRLAAIKAEGGVCRPSPKELTAVKAFPLIVRRVLGPPHIGQPERLLPNNGLPSVRRSAGKGKAVFRPIPKGACGVPQGAGTLGGIASRMRVFKGPTPGGPGESWGPSSTSLCFRVLAVRVGPTSTKSGASRTESPLLTLGRTRLGPDRLR